MKPKTEQKNDPGWRKFVLLSDLHLHPWAAFSKGEGSSNTRLQHSLRVLTASLEKAQELRCSWVFGGDIVHTAGYTLNYVMAELVTVLLAYPEVQKLVIWGNHDARGIGGKIKLNQTVMATLKRAVPNLFILDESGVVGCQGLTFSGASYQPRPEFIQWGQRSDVGVYHQTVQGTKTPNGFELEEGIPAKTLMALHRVAVVGHVHHWQYHPAAGLGQLLLIPGSPEQHNFGDTGDHGWWIIQVPEDPASYPSVKLMSGGSPSFATVDSPGDVRSDGNFYRVRSVGAGESLPDNAAVIASAPNAVEQRNVLNGAHGEQVVEAWTKIEPHTLDPQAVLAAGKELLDVREATNLRPFRLTRLHLKNFCSYGNVDIPIEPGTRLVIGKGKDFPSNGAGKSTLFEAIYWLLFGSTTKGQTGDEVIRWGTKECSVEALLQDLEGATVHIVRSRGTKSQLHVTFGDKSGFGAQEVEGKSVTEITEKLHKFLGITPDLFKALGYFSQEDLILFASATDGKRKDMLADLIGLGAYQDASTAAGRKADEALSIVKQLETLIEAAYQRDTAERLRLEESQRLSADWQLKKAARRSVALQDVARFDINLKQQRKRLEDEHRLLVSPRVIEREYRASSRLIAATAAAALPFGPTSTQKEVIEANTAEARARESFHAAEAQVVEAGRQRSAQEKRIQSYEAALASGICPTCNQQVSTEHKVVCLAPDLLALGQLLVRCTELDLHKRTLAGAAANAAIHAQSVTAGFEAAKLSVRCKDELDAAQAEVLSVGQERDALEFSITTTAQAQLDRLTAGLRSAVDTIEAEQNPYAIEQVGINERLEVAALGVQQQETQRDHILLEAAAYSYWQKGFSKQGVQSLLLDEVAGLFNEGRGAVFPALTQGVYDVQFSTLSRTKSGEARERTEFQVFAHGEQVPYNSLSGGQRRRIDVGVMLVLVKAVSRWMQVPGALGILVLDEVCGFLDASGAEGLMEALREVQEQIPAIFVVSHDSQLQALFPEVITVIQDQDGVSHVSSGEAE